MFEIITKGLITNVAIRFYQSKRMFVYNHGENYVRILILDIKQLLTL